MSDSSLFLKVWQFFPLSIGCIFLELPNYLASFPGSPTLELEHGNDSQRSTSKKEQFVKPSCEISACTCYRMSVLVLNTHCTASFCLLPSFFPPSLSPSFLLWISPFTCLHSSSLPPYPFISSLSPFFLQLTSEIQWSFCFSLKSILCKESRGEEFSYRSVPQICPHSRISPPAFLAQTRTEVFLSRT